MDDKRLLLKHLLNTKEWQNIQDNFSSVTGVGLRTIDETGISFTSPSGETRLCNELIQESPFKDTICGECLPTFLGGEHVVNRNLDFVCLPGLHNFVAPLTLESGKVLGYLILGPMYLVTRKSKEEYRHVAEELKLDLEQLWDALLEIKAVSFQAARSLVELIKDVAEFTLKCNYQSIMREEEVVLAADSPQLSRILEVLLDVAFQVSGADVGSIMFLEEDAKTLAIQSSRGIPDDIAKDTRVKLGEGISGIVAQENRPLLLDDTLTNTTIKNRLTRPQLKSAMVLPIKTQDRVLGVMNLGILRTSPANLDLDNLRLMNKLIDLATVAITPTK